jgi:hypothetical protein
MDVAVRAAYNACVPRDDRIDPRWSVERHEAERSDPADQEPANSWFGKLLVALAAAFLLMSILALAGVITLPHWLLDALGGGG